MYAGCSHTKPKVNVSSIDKKGEKKIINFMRRLLRGIHQWRNKKNFRRLARNEEREGQREVTLFFSMRTHVINVSDMVCYGEDWRL